MNQFKILIFHLFLLSMAIPCASQSSWESLAEMPITGTERMSSFEIDGIVYVMGGRDISSTNRSSVWAYDHVANSWTEKNNFPGMARRNAFAFSIDGIGYFGSGFSSIILSDFWRYSPADDTWTQLSDFPGDPRSHSVAVSTNSKAYVMGGRGLTAPFFNDLWEFDPATESWTMLENLPAPGRWRSFSWVIGQTIYFGGGAQFPLPGLQDLYAYDIMTGTWEEKVSCPTRSTSGGFYFSLENKGYFLEGATLINSNIGTYGNQLYSYDPLSDEWTIEESFIGQPRVLGFNVVVEDRVILGLGRNYLSGEWFNDVFSFTPGLISSTNHFIEDSSVSVYPNPATSIVNIETDFENITNLTYNIFDVLGILKLSIKADDLFKNGASNQIDITQLSKGMYYLEIKSNDISTMKTFIKE